MGLSCSCHDGDPDWWYQAGEDFSVLSTKRSRRCCSCGCRIKPGEDVLAFRRWRSPTERCNFLEEAIYGDEVPLADWYMCETCGGLYMAVDDLGMCCDINESIASQIREYMTEEAHYREQERQRRAKQADSGPALPENIQ